jgi:plasmid maintenance system killer protein
VQQNLKAKQDEFRERTNTLNEKARQRLEQVNDNEEKRNLRSMKQREIDHLRYMDNVENQESLKARKFKENC